MIQGIVTVFGLCLITVSPQTSIYNERMLLTLDNLNMLFNMVWMRAEDGAIVQSQESDATPETRKQGDQLCDKEDMPALAMLDECMPRLTTVEIPREPNDDINVKLWPPTIRIKRCGSCSPNEGCVVKDAVDRQFRVMEVRLSDSGTSEMRKEFEALRRVKILEHTACENVCMIRAKDCNLGQRFDDATCQCECLKLHDCSSLQRWNWDTCRCVCKNPNRTCPPGTAVNPETCICWNIRMKQISVTVTSDDEEQDDEIPPTNEDDDSLEQEETTTTTPTTTTTRPTTTADYNPCAHSFYCPPFFTMDVLDGRCICNYSGRFRK